MSRKKTVRYQWDGEKILALRSILRLTQSEMAEQLGTRQQTISEWEKGMYRPRGASATLLTIVAEQARVKYQAEVKELDTMSSKINRSKQWQPIKNTVERNGKILEYRDQGLTYNQIAILVADNGKPLSRQRIHQIVKKGTPANG